MHRMFLFAKCRGKHWSTTLQFAKMPLRALTSRGSARAKSCPCRSAGDEGSVEPRRRNGYSLRARFPWLPHNRRRDRGLREGEWGIERQQRSGGWRRKVEEVEEEEEGRRVCRAAWLDTPLQALSQTDRQTHRKLLHSRTFVPFFVINWLPLNCFISLMN